MGKLFSLTEGYSPSDIYNADERELINDLQKIQLFVIQMKNYFTENSQLFITILLAVNVDETEKFTSFVLGKDSKA